MIWSYSGRCVGRSGVWYGLCLDLSIIVNNTRHRLKKYQSPAFQLADDVKKISSTELKRGDETKRGKIGWTFVAPPRPRVWNLDGAGCGLAPAGAGLSLKAWSHSGPSSRFLSSPSLGWPGPSLVSVSPPATCGGSDRQPPSSSSSPSPPSPSRWMWATTAFWTKMPPRWWLKVGT